MSTLRHEFDARLLELQGARLVGARQVDVDEAPRSDALHVGPFDVASVGVELTFEDGRVYVVSAGDEFARFGVSVRRGGIGGGAGWSAASDRRWAPYFGRRIESVLVVWLTHEREGVEYPQVLWLGFEGGASLYLAAASYHPESGTFQLAADAITIVFDERYAARLGLSLES